MPETGTASRVRAGNSPTAMYRRSLQRARAATDDLVRVMSREVVQSYAEMIIAIDALGDTNPLQEARLAALRRSIREEMAKFGVNFERALNRHTLRAAQVSAVAHSQAVTAAGIAAGVTISQNFSDVPVSALNAMWKRRAFAVGQGEAGFTARYRTLIKRNLQDAAADVDKLLIDAVGRGLSASDTTRALASRLASGDSVTSQAVNQIGARGGLTRAAREAGVRTGGVDLKKARSLMRAANLIATHEINSAYDEADKYASHKSRLVGGLIWRLSGRHDGLRSSPDECDVAARTDAYGLGPGVYPTDSVPALMHPRCMCYTEKILRRVSDWNKPKTPTRRSGTPISEEDTRRLLHAAETQYSRRVTRSVVKRSTKTFNEHVEVVDRARRDFR